ncbi:MAG: protein kinase domain-containing protein [Amnibacterium sp.]
MPVVRSAPAAVLDGRYRLGPLLGRGGMADVWRATDLTTGTDVAIKLFRDDVSAGVDPDRAAKETAAARGLRHPAVVQVLGTSPQDGESTYLVLELVEGGDLGALLEEGPLEPEVVREIAADVADALTVLHARRLVHRDVKPGNILVLDTPGPVAAKLADFGIVAALDGTRLTATDTILGTAAYLSPEQVQGAEVGTASDVYALGLVLLEALTGERAFPGGLAESAIARLNRPPRLPPDASPRLASLLSAMTALDPAQRPRATEVAATLRALAGAMTGDPDATGRVVRVESAPAARPPAPLRLVGAAAAVVVALGTGVALLTDGATPAAVPVAAGTAPVAPDSATTPKAVPTAHPSPTAVPTASALQAVVAISATRSDPPPTPVRHPAATASPVPHAHPAHPAPAHGKPAHGKHGTPPRHGGPAQHAKPPHHAKPPKPAHHAPKPVKGAPGRH